MAKPTEKKSIRFSFCAIARAPCCNRKRHVMNSTVQIRWFCSHKHTVTIHRHLAFCSSHRRRHRRRMEKLNFFSVVTNIKIIHNWFALFLSLSLRQWFNFTCDALIHTIRRRKKKKTSFRYVRVSRVRTNCDLVCQLVTNREPTTNFVVFAIQTASTTLTPIFTYTYRVQKKDVSYVDHRPPRERNGKYKTTIVW